MDNTISHYLDHVFNQQVFHFNSYEDVEYFINTFQLGKSSIVHTDLHSVIFPLLTENISLVDHVFKISNDLHYRIQLFLLNGQIGFIGYDYSTGSTSIIGNTAIIGCVKEQLCFDVVSTAFTRNIIQNLYNLKQSDIDYLNDNILIYDTTTKERIMVDLTKTSLISRIAEMRKSIKNYYCEALLNEIH